jgi:ribonuclease BN (tRNA processing enzyme)
MKVTFLGVGSAFSRKYANSNILVESGAVKLLIDCSHSAPRALEEYGLSLKDVTHVFITHLHADHIGGLEEYAFQAKLFYNRKPVIMTTETLLDRLWHASLRGGLEFFEEKPGHSQPLTLQDYFNPKPVAPESWFTIGKNPGLRIRPHPTNHVQAMECYGLEVEELPEGQEKRFFFSGDTKFDSNLILHGVQTSSLIFHDCQLYDLGKDNERGVHASYQQLLTLPDDVRRRMWLYHYEDTPLPDAEKDGFAGFITELQSFVI